jgi:hypothetical protein
MSLLTIQQRLNALFPALQSPRLLQNQGIGNEIGFYIFDYDPEHEPLVQQQIAKLRSRLESSPINLKILEINLYQAILDILEKRRVLQKAFELEANKGSTDLEKSIKPMVRPEQIVDYIQQKLQGDEQLIFLTGVGAATQFCDRTPFLIIYILFSIAFHSSCFFLDHTTGTNCDCSTHSKTITITVPFR